MLAARGDSSTREVTSFARDTTERHFRISSPQDGDRFRIPADVDARYATTAQRAEGADAGAVHWFIDGQPTRSRRLSLVPGTHIVRASASTAGNDEVRITIER
jgi:hypothetical protein